MRNPYVQVALTYPRRLLGSWYLMVILAGPVIAIITVFMTSSHIISGAFVIWLWFPYMIFLAHVKEQFANSRARLMPGFVRPHLIIAAAAAALITVVLAVTIALARGVPILGVVALFVGAFGVTAWSMIAGSWWASGLMLAMVFGVLFPPGSRWVVDLLEGRYPGAETLLLLAGIVAAVAAALRLLRLNEEMPTYHQVQAFDLRWTKAAPRPTGPAQPGQGSSWLQSFTYYLQDAQMERLIAASTRAPHSAWARVRRWQVGLIGEPALALLALGVFGFTELFAWLTAGLSGRAVFHEMSWLGFALMAVTLISVGGLTQRRPALSREFLLPVERPAFLRQAALAMFLTHLKICLALMLPIVVTGLIHRPDQIRWTTWGWSLAIFAPLQVCCLAVTLWLLRYRAQGARLALFMGTIMATAAAIPLLQIGQDRNWAGWHAPALAAAGGLALLGLLILYDAYRRWLRTEMG